VFAAKKKVRPNEERTEKVDPSHCCDTISNPFRDEEREKTPFTKIFSLNEIKI